MSRFNDNILKVARRLKESRVTADEVNTNFGYSGQLLADIENRAILELVKDLQKIFGDKFGDVVPEMIKTGDVMDQIDGKYAIPTDAWLIMSLRSTVIYYRLEQKDVDSVITGTHGKIVPTDAKPRFYQQETSIYVLPSTLNEWVVPTYIYIHPELTIAGSESTPSPIPEESPTPGIDIILNKYWDGDIQDRMFKIAKGDIAG